jgi:hypothetical protein
MNARMTSCFLVVTIASAFLPRSASAQTVAIQSVEVTPFVWGRFGGTGTVSIQPDGPGEIEIPLKDTGGYGVSAGVRFDDFSMVEFRWTTTKSALMSGAGVGPLPAGLADVTMSQLHADFTREFDVQEVRGLRSFLTGMVGATHLGTGNEGFTRLSFGLGGGLKLFLGSRLGVRAQAQWLSIWLEPELNGFACGSGGCLVVLGGRWTDQFEVNIGPVIRF